MTDRIARRIAAHRAEDTRRAADQAEAAGVRILVERATGQHVATDPAAPSIAFFVDVRGCSCRHFGTWHRCGHHALLLSELGLIEDAGGEEPDRDDLPPSCGATPPARGGTACSPPSPARSAPPPDRPRPTRPRRGAPPP